MFSGVGAFTRCSIQFNGPYDYDGSPTDMEVSLGFMPSEMYDSTTMVTAIANPTLVPVSTPTGETLVTGGTLYALTFGETSTSPTPSGTSAPGTQNPQQSTPSSSKPGEPATIQANQVQGPTSPTPTEPEVAAAFKTTPDNVSRDPLSGIYTIDGVQYNADEVQRRVAKAQAATPDIGSGD
jgi:hypothetical protein